MTTKTKHTLYTSPILTLEGEYFKFHPIVMDWRDQNWISLCRSAMKCLWNLKGTTAIQVSLSSIRRNSSYRVLSLDDDLIRLEGMRRSRVERLIINEKLLNQIRRWRTRGHVYVYVDIVTE